jgi:hypothetical protein
MWQTRTPIIVKKKTKHIPQRKVGEKEKKRF